MFWKGELCKLCKLCSKANTPSFFFFFSSSKLRNTKTIYREWIRDRLEENLDQGALKFRSKKILSEGQDLKKIDIWAQSWLSSASVHLSVTQCPWAASHQPSPPGWKAPVQFSLQWALIFNKIWESHSNINNFPGKFTPGIVPRCHPDTALTLGSPARAVPPLHEPQVHQAPSFCSTICGIWGAVVLWTQLYNNTHILQLSFGHGRCNYRAAWGISSASAVIISQHSDIWADKFCGCKQQRLTENLNTSV